MSGQTDTCRHCGKQIVFDPYYVDHKPGPNPSVWFHPPGVFTCYSADGTLTTAAPAVMAEEIEEAT